jgi:uncharacterized MAPEG superfamily protein
MKAGAAAAAYAWLHVFFRVLYWVCYAANVPNVRTVCYMLGFQTAALSFLEALF